MAPIPSGTAACIKLASFFHYFYRVGEIYYIGCNQRGIFAQAVPGKYGRFKIILSSALLTWQFL